MIIYVESSEGSTSLVVILGDDIFLYHQLLQFPKHHTWYVNAQYTVTIQPFVFGTMNSSRDRSSLPAAAEHADNDIELDPWTETQTNVVNAIDTPPDGSYGWVVCGCVFFINAHTFGVNSAWGVFLAHFLSRSTFEGATHLQYALIGGLAISQALVVSTVVASSNEKLGIRFSLFLGTLLVSASLLAASYISSSLRESVSVLGWGFSTSQLPLCCHSGFRNVGV
jgi:hypothetical protein